MITEIDYFLHKKKYYQLNKETVKKNQQDYALNKKCEKKAYDIAYREANKDIIKEQKKLQYQNRKLLKQELLDKVI